MGPSFPKWLLALDFRRKRAAEPRFAAPGGVFSPGLPRERGFREIPARNMTIVRERFPVETPASLI
jgi:hypothetical protein